jgi:protein SCO1
MIASTLTRAVAAALLLFTISSCGARHGQHEQVQELPELGPAPVFSGENFDGRRINNEDLQGSIYIAYFFFTSCAGPCPVMNSKANVLQAAYARQADFRIVGFTVDPENDTVQRLARYADRYSARSDRWFMLRTTEEEVLEISARGFRLGDTSDPEMHSTRFALVDRSGVIRGYYDGMEDVKMAELRAAIDFLLGGDA